MGCPAASWGLPCTYSKDKVGSQSVTGGAWHMRQPQGASSGLESSQAGFQHCIRCYGGKHTLTCPLKLWPAVLACGEQHEH